MKSYHKLSISIILLVGLVGTPLTTMAQDVFDWQVSKEEAKTIYTDTSVLNKHRYQIWVKLSSYLPTGFGQSALVQQQNFFRFLDDKQYFKLPPTRRPFFWSKYQALHPVWMKKLVAAEGLTYIPFPDSKLDPQVATLSTYAYSRIGGQNIIEISEGDRVFWNTFYATAAKKLGLPLNEQLAPFEPQKLEDVVFNKSLFAKKLPTLYELLYSRPIPSSEDLNRWRIKWFEYIGQVYGTENPYSSDFDVVANTVFSPERRDVKRFAQWTNEELSALKKSYEYAFVPLIKRTDKDLLLENLGVNLNPVMLLWMPFFLGYIVDKDTGEGRASLITEDIQAAYEALKPYMSKEALANLDWKKIGAIGGGALATIGLSKYGGKALGEFALYRALRTQQVFNALDATADLSKGIPPSRAKLYQELIQAADDEAYALSQARAGAGFGVSQTFATLKTTLVNSAKKIFQAAKDLKNIGKYDQERISWWEARYLKIFEENPATYTMEMNLLWAIRAVDEGEESTEILTSLLKSGLTKADVALRAPVFSPKLVMELADKYPRGLPPEMVAKIEDAFAAAKGDFRVVSSIIAEARLNDALRAFSLQPSPKILQLAERAKAKGLAKGLARQGKAAIQHIDEFETFFFSRYPDALRAGLRLDFGGDIARSIARLEDLPEGADDIVILISYADPKVLGNFGGTAEGLQEAIKRDFIEYATFHPEHSDLLKHLNEGATNPLELRIKIVDATTSNAAFNKLIGLDEFGEETFGLSIDRAVSNRYGDVPKIIAERDEGIYLSGIQRGIKDAKNKVTRIVLGKDARNAHESEYINLKTLIKQKYGTHHAFAAETLQTILRNEEMTLKGYAPAEGSRSFRLVFMNQEFRIAPESTSAISKANFDKTRILIQLAHIDDIEVFNAIDKSINGIILPKTLIKILKMAESRGLLKRYLAYWQEDLFPKIFMHEIDNINRIHSYGIFEFYNKLIWQPSVLRSQFPFDSAISDMLHEVYEHSKVINKVVRTNSTQLYDKLDKIIEELAQPLTKNNPAEQSLQGEIIGYEMRRAVYPNPATNTTRNIRNFVTKWIDLERTISHPRLPDGTVTISLQRLYEQPIINRGLNFTPTQLSQGLDNFEEAIKMMANDTIFTKDLDWIAFKENITNIKAIDRMKALGTCSPVCNVNPNASHAGNIYLRTIKIDMNHLVGKAVPGEEELSAIETIIHEFIHTTQIRVSNDASRGIKESVTEYLARAIFMRATGEKNLFAPRFSSGYDNGIKVIDKLEKLFAERFNVAGEDFLKHLWDVNRGANWNQGPLADLLFAAKIKTPDDKIIDPWFYVENNIILLKDKEMEVKDELVKWLERLLKGENSYLDSNNGFTVLMLLQTFAVTPN